MPKVAPPVRTGKASLFLTIDDQPYRLRPSKAEGCSRSWRLSKVHSSPKQYAVAKRADGRLTCTCPDFWRHGSNDGFKCKHILALIAVGLLSPRKPRPSEIYCKARRVLRGLGIGEGGTL